MVVPVADTKVTVAAIQHQWTMVTTTVTTTVTVLGMTMIAEITGRQWRSEGLQRAARAEAAATEPFERGKGREGREN